MTLVAKAGCSDDALTDERKCAAMLPWHSSISARPQSPPACAAYPERQIHVYVGFPPGSGADILGRYFSRKLSDLAGKPVIVENKPGATSNIAVGLAAKAKPDGYTMLYSANSNMAGNRFLFKDLPFDTVRTSCPSLCFRRRRSSPSSRPVSPIRSIADLSNAVKANPRAKFAYTNQIGLLATEYLQARGRPDRRRRHLPHRHRRVARHPDGTVDFMIIDGTFGSGQIKAGRIKPLAVTTAQRLVTMPDVPTMIEAGVPGFDFASWWAAWLPKGRRARRSSPNSKAGSRQITARPETREFLSDDCRHAAARRKRGDPRQTAHRDRKMGSRHQGRRHRPAVRLSAATRTLKPQTSRLPQPVLDPPNPPLPHRARHRKIRLQRVRDPHLVVADTAVAPATLYSKFAQLQRTVPAPLRPSRAPVQDASTGPARPELRAVATAIFADMGLASDVSRFRLNSARRRHNDQHCTRINCEAL